MRALRLCCLLAAAWQARAEGPVADESALLQRDVQLHTVPSAPELFNSFVQDMVKKVSVQLSKYEIKLGSQRREAAEVGTYLEKAKSNIGKSGTAFSDLMGLMPIGQANEAERRMGAKLLALLRDKQAAAALQKAAQGLGNALKAFALRTERQVTDLVVVSANKTEKDLPAVVANFFMQEKHIVVGLLTRLQEDFGAVLAALPEEEGDFVKSFSGRFVSQLVANATQAIGDKAQLIAQSNGTRFCSEVEPLFRDQVMPNVNKTLLALPLLEEFARAQAPEAAGPVAEAAKKLAAVADAILPALRKEASVWVEKVCGLVATLP
mmetsp:Transcript_26267/g.81621  ORF Transcript_26267/g.81621 Transcript_26267/m.81621 type:complete len:322 (+) Transcript_26267:40-1005(+)